MKKTPILSTFLALAMLLSLLTGCGGETPSVPSASIESTTESAAVSESSAPEPVAPEEVSALSAVESSEEESRLPAPVPVTLPLTQEPVTYTIWYCEPFGELVDDPAQDVAVFRLLSERTGIQFNFTLTTMEAAKEKFQLPFRRKCILSATISSPMPCPITAAVSTMR